MSVPAARPREPDPKVLPAATVVLLRAQPDLEVFLLRRHGQSGFMAGATVFPGGKVDLADRDMPAAGRADSACATLLGLAEPLVARAFFVAALRELHEESHVLLARDRQGHLATPEAIAAIDARLDAERAGHRLPQGAWARALAEKGLTPALDLLVPFAHWVTPQVEPRRFDTYFFVAACPPGQDAALDQHESTDAFWLAPAAALTAHDAGGALLLPPPTQHTLQRLLALQTGLGPGADAAGVLSAWEREGVGPRIQPWFQADGEAGPVIALPWDRLHPEAAPGAGQDRFVMQDGRFTRRIG